MTHAKLFPLADVLTITTGFVVSPEKIGAVYKILNFMTGDEIFTHQIPRVVRECTPWLLRQHPALASVDTAVLDAFAGSGKSQDEIEHAIALWVEAQVARFGETLAIAPIPRDGHERIDPVEELKRIVGPEKVIVVEVPK